MPSVTYNGQSFMVDGRRIWLLGATLQYARIPENEWADRIADARQAGFNTIDVACPWSFHEPRKGRYDFEGRADVAAFVRQCAEADMRVILRPGPFVGCGFDGGGLPSWLLEDPKVAAREANEAFLDRASRYFRKLLAELTELQAGKDGPIILVQVEHAWMCANDDQADRYLREIGRVIRECGFAVPLINANNFWLDSVGTIETWQGDDDLLANLRQLRSVQPEAPRLVRAFESATEQVWGQPRVDPLGPSVMLRRLAEVLAAGAQPIVCPFHGGTNLGFLGGRLPGAAGGSVTTSAAAGTPLGEGGARGATYNRIRRIVTFADQFSHIFGDLDPDYQPVAIDPREIAEPRDRARSGGRANGKSTGTFAIVPLRGAGGRVVFVFGGDAARRTTLLLDSGVRLPVDLGDQPVGWFVMDADLHGQGRLDYANLCPFAIVDRSIVVLQGPARTSALLSVNGTPFHATVPNGTTPVVEEHKGITFVICNQKQIDVTYHDDTTVYVGIDGFDAEGRPRPADGWTKIWTIDRTNGLAALGRDADTAAPARRKPRSIALKDWHGVGADEHTDGNSPRFASLPGPQTLTACGAPIGYGWYRIRVKGGGQRKRLLHLPGAGDRIHLFADGAPLALFGSGPGADAGPLELSLPTGAATITALADNLGGFAGGNDGPGRAGIYDHLYVVEPVGAKPKLVERAAVDPFEIRAFLLGRSVGQMSDVEQVEWSFAHHKKTPILVDIVDAGTSGTFVLNDQPIAYFAGESGSRRLRLTLDPSMECFKRGKNVLRFAPDVDPAASRKEIARATTLYVCTEALTANADWAFAKWEPPIASAFTPVASNAPARGRGIPAWWRTRFTVRDLGGPLWFVATGLSKGVVMINDEHVGRYFTSTAAGKTVGPQHRLYIPRAWVRLGEPNDLVVFDEHGFKPTQTKLIVDTRGDLDGP